MYMNDDKIFAENEKETKIIFKQHLRMELDKHLGY